MDPVEKIKSAYDEVSRTYADKFMHELSEKPFDRMILMEFASQNKNNVADFGCGPGQTTRMLKQFGVKKLLGIDLSPKMIEVAKEMTPGIQFETGNLLDLEFPDHFFKAAIAFYAIVNFNMDQLKKALSEIFRVLDKNGEFLFSFHIGTGIYHQDQFLDHDVALDFYFFETEKVLELAKKTGFKIKDAVERYPYDQVEFPSKRAYIWLKK